MTRGGGVQPPQYFDVQVRAAVKVRSTFAPTAPEVDWQRSPAAFKRMVVDVLRAVGAELHDSGIELVFTIETVRSTLAPAPE